MCERECVVCFTQRVPGGVIAINMSDRAVGGCEECRVQNSSRLPARAGTLATLAGDFSSQKKNKMTPHPFISKINVPGMS